MAANKKMPFRFEFFYEPASDDLNDILLIDAPSEVPPLHLNIINNLVDQPITIPASETDGLVTLDNYHFKLKFNSETLVEAENILLSNSNWVLAHAKEAGSSSDGLYLCLKGEDIILGSDKPIELIFNGVAATDFQTETRTSGTSVEMSWVLQIEQLAQSLDGEEHDGERETLTLTPRAPGDSGGYETTSTKTLEKVKQKGKPNIPLSVGFVGSNRVLNTNSQESNLQLRLTNTDEPGTPNIIFYYDSDITKCSQLGIALEVGDTTAFPWVLGTKDDVNNITMSIAGDKWKQLGDKPTEVIVGGVSALEWTFIPNSASVELAAQETILVDIQKIKTAHPTGATKLNLRYQYVPEYQDGEFVCAIEKTPLVFHDYKVGIGTTQPKESLHIKAGNLRIEHTDPSTNGEIQTNGTLVLRSNVDKTEDLSVKFFNKTGDPLMVLDKNGQLGIGIGAASPSAKLHVKGGNAIIEDSKVGIGINNPKQTLHVAGDYYGKGHIWLYANEGDGKDGTAYIQARNDSTSSTIGLKLRTQNSGQLKEVMYLKPDGNVGIGIDDPQVKLHVNGRIKDQTGFVIPVGTVVPYAGSTAPEGWFLCHGQSFDINRYSELYQVLGSKNTVPDLRERFIAGASARDGYSLNQTGGEERHTLTISEMPSHNHNNDEYNRLLKLCGDSSDACNDWAHHPNRPNAVWSAGIQSAGGNQSHENRPPFYALNYIIKA